MMKELPKVYEPQQVESRIYQMWEDNDCFNGDPDPKKKPFSIVMPPPNVTGQLHMGHALDCTLQDILTRFKRMQGYSTLWVPGTDHAGIATQIKVEEELRVKEGLTRYDLGREKFLQRVWKWKEEYGNRIVEQQKKMGVSCDWSRSRFTMDEGCSKAVRETFCELYDKGLIYKGSRIINWCPHCITALSDAEVEYVDKPGHLWHIRYPLADGSGDLVVATTRPETMMGDTGVAVNPEDERFRDLVGKTCILPIMNREIPIVADDYVELGFGTGAVKMIPTTSRWACAVTWRSSAASATTAGSTRTAAPTMGWTGTSAASRSSRTWRSRAISSRPSPTATMWAPATAFTMTWSP